MKLTFILTVLITLKSFSQIPNNGFETWTNYGIYQDPASWTSSNSTTYITGIFTCFQSTPGFVGSSYLSLLTKTFSPSGILNGYIASGIPIPGPTTNYKGYPFTNRPATLNGAWQYAAPTSSSNCNIIVYLTKWNATLLKRDTICYQTTVLTGTVSSWAAFSINLNSGYKSAANPDSCIISMRSNLTSTLSVGDYLNIDDLSFNGTVTGLAENKNDLEFTIYPNPTNEQLNFIFPDFIAQKEIIISDELGREVIKTTESKIDVSNLSRGIYVATLKANGKTARKKVIKN